MYPSPRAPRALASTARRSHVCARVRACTGGSLSLSGAAPRPHARRRGCAARRRGCRCASRRAPAARWWAPAAAARARCCGCCSASMTRAAAPCASAATTSATSACRACATRSASCRRRAPSGREKRAGGLAAAQGLRASPLLACVVGLHAGQAALPADSHGATRWGLCAAVCALHARPPGAPHGPDGTVAQQRGRPRGAGRTAAGEEASGRGAAGRARGARARGANGRTLARRTWCSSTTPSTTTSCTAAWARRRRMCLPPRGRPPCTTRRARRAARGPAPGHAPGLVHRCPSPTRAPGRPGSGCDVQRDRLARALRRGGRRMHGRGGLPVPAGHGRGGGRAVWLEADMPVTRTRAAHMRTGAGAAGR